MWLLLSRYLINKLAKRLNGNNQSSYQFVFYRLIYQHVVLYDKQINFGLLFN